MLPALLNAQNLGFEATASSPPSNWTVVTGVWNTNTSAIRTGAQSMSVTDPATTGTTLGTTNPFVTTTSAGNYLIVMGWGRSNTASNALFYLGYRSGTANTLNPTTTTSGQTANVNNTSWNRVVSVSTATVAAGSYGVSLRAFRSAATTGTDVYIDDIIMYASTSNVADLSAPNPATGAQAAGSNLIWVNGTDNGSPASGVAGMVIVRASGTGLAAPTLNDQAMYATTTGASGTSSFVQSGVTWTVVGNITDGTTTNFSDPIAGAGPYTYVVFLRDMAYNYSSGSVATVAGACTAPPIAGTSVVTPSTIQCATVARTLTLSGSSFGTGLTYVWQSSPTLTGAYTNVSSSSSSSALNINPTVTAFYRCAVTCSGNTANSAPVEVLVNPALPTGMYTINNTLPTSGGNYTNFTDAINALSCGIAGPITFNVAAGSGPYNEQITIPAVLGTSNTNKIVFNCNGVSLNYTSSNTNARAGITFSGADFVTIDSLNIDGSAGTYAWGIILTNGSDSNTIKKCTINVGNLSSTSTNYIGIVINGSTTTTATSGNNANGNQIIGNTINGGYYGVYLYGSTGSTTQNVNNTLRGNILKDSYLYAVFANYMPNGLTITQNDMSRPTRGTVSTWAGVFLTTGCSGVLVERNAIHNGFDGALSSNSTMYGVYVSTDAAAGQENKIINNIIYNFSGNGAHYGIYNTGGDYMQAYHNTIVMNNLSSNPTGAAYGIYQTTLATGINIRNNLVYITKANTGIKRCLHYNTTTSTIISNKNILYLNAGGGTDNHIGQFGTTNYTTLTNWKTANSNTFDQGSLDVDPLFADLANGDFTPTEASINGIGDNVGVSIDIFENSRSSTPDPGAVEFNLLGCTGVVDAGTATASVSSVCTGISFTLNLTGHTTGTGISHQWQSSANNSSWTNLGSSQAGALLNISQTDTTYYRCIIVCNSGVPDTSIAVQVNTPALVAGTFTINNSLPTGGTNFQSFGDAVSYMNCGIGGPIVFNVEAGSGPYSEQVVIPSIIGASSVNTITFNGNGATLSFNSTNANSRAGILFNGADFVTIDSLVIDGSAGTYAWGAVLTNKSDSNILRKCTINIGNLASTSTNYMGIVINGSATTTAISGDNGNGNQFLGNTINGGYYNIYLYGNSASTIQNINNVVQDNVVNDAYFYSIYCSYISDGTKVRKNDISRPNRSTVTTAAGVFITTGCLGTLVERNKVHNLFDGAPTSTSTSYGFYCSADGKANKENKFINNVVYNMNGNGTVYGIYNTGGDSMIAYHNTIILEDAATASGAAYGIYQTGAATGILLKNNIINISRSGTGIKRCLYFVTTTSGIASNKNVLYMNAPTGTDNHLGQFGTITYAMLANWQTANSNAYDQGSLSLDPQCTNANSGDLTPQNTSIANLGESLGVITDINGITRSSATPDPGAVEFSILSTGLDVLAESLITPAVSAQGCYTSAQTVSVKIRNNSTSTLNFVTNPVTVSVAVTGAVTQNLSTVVNTGTLASDSSLVVVIPTALNMTNAGIYDISGSSVATGDVNTVNNTFAVPAQRIKQLLTTGIVTASPSAYCGNAGISPTLSTSSFTGYSSLQWQQSTTSGSGFTNISGATNSTYAVSGGISATTYYRAIATCGTNSINSEQDTVVFSNPQILTTVPRYTCGSGSVILDATATPGSIIKWYATATGGAELATGTRFTTPTISTSTTYYVSAADGANSTSQNVGAADLSIGAAAVVGTYYANFTVTAACTIQSVNCYFNTVGSNFVLNIRDATTQATVFTYSGVTTASGTSTPQVLPINATLNPGTYQIGWATDPGTYRNNTGGAYPYTIPGVLSITGNSFNDNNYYYYFYNWLVSTGCESARTPVLATVDNSPGCVPLLVSLTSFTGKKEGKYNFLNWATSQELNNKGFFIERSTDGKNFSNIQYVASKAINGSSSNNLHYNATDEKPFAGDNYYRLNQQDKDGRTTRSNVILLKGSKSTKLELVDVYPNPAKEKVQVVINTPQQQAVKLVITDLTGKLIHQQSTIIAEGVNNIELNTISLTTGTYLLKILCNNYCISNVKKLIKH